MEQTSNCNEEKKKDQELTGRPWSELPMELLNLTLSRLFVGDHMTFRLVCKQWHIPKSEWLFPQLDLSANSPPETPILFNIESNGICKFFNPVSNAIHQMDIPELIGARVRYSDDDWLLMYKECNEAFFFNPYTKATIELPRMPDRSPVLNLCFLSPPTSSNCFIIGLNMCKGRGEVCTLKLGEDWNVQELYCPQSFIQFDCNPVLHKGKYYFLSIDGDLGELEFKNDNFHWSFLKSGFKRRLHFHRSFLVENNGELVGVFRTWNNVRVFRWNESKKEWQRLTSLGDRMLFMSRGRCFSEKAVVGGTGNKIYFPCLHGKNFPVYSLSTLKYHSFYDTEFSSRRSLNMKEFNNSTWMKPSWTSQRG